eukprot:1232421-Rhodomonas_salina.2
MAVCCPVLTYATAGTRLRILPYLRPAPTRAGTTAYAISLALSYALSGTRILLTWRICYGFFCTETVHIAMGSARLIEYLLRHGRY